MQDAMIAAVVLAAGLSRRMGEFKLLLPWDGTTVIGRVVATLESAGVPDIVVVTGHRADLVAQSLAGSTARFAFNPNYAAAEMMSTIQVGLRALGPQAEAALICLGDQPQMEASTVSALVAEASREGWNAITIPSYGMRGGHPILLARVVWPDVLSAAGTLREVVHADRSRVYYRPVATTTVLADLDTPEDYRDSSR